MTTTCNGCVLAEWERTKTGRLHPGKQGRCKYFETAKLDLRLPAAFWWSFNEPRPTGGRIERDRKHTQPCEFRIEPKKGGAR